MQLVTLSGTIFCSANWDILEIEVMGISKEQCLEYFLKHCTGIHLIRSSKLKKVQLDIDCQEWIDANPEFDKFNVEFEVFKANPEKYIDLNWDIVTLPIVTVK